MKLTALLVYMIFLGTPAFAENILVVGDSLACGPLGMSLYSEMSKNPANQVTVYCTVSSSPTHWLNGKNPSVNYPCHSCSGDDCKPWVQKKRDEEGMALCQEFGQGQTPKLADLLQRKKFGKVMVVLGTNRPVSATEANSSYGDLASVIGNSGVSTCDWIGPAYRDETKPVSTFQEEAKYDNEESYLKAKYKGYRQDDDRKANKTFNATLPSFYNSLEAKVNSKCKVFNSGSQTEKLEETDTAKDGYHHSAGISEKWGRAVLQSESGKRKDAASR